jgi:hypothetical protein
VYALTLTREERKAFDWVGDRYSTGTEFKRHLVVDCHQYRNCNEEYCDCKEWDKEGDLTFYVPQPVAWELQELAEEDNFTFPCFSDGLRTKLNEFLSKVV